MKKKSIALGLIICMTLSLCACQDSKQEQDNKETKPSVSVTEEATPTPTEATPKPTEEATPEPTKEATPEPTKEAESTLAPEKEDGKEASKETDKEAAKIDEDWSKMQFSFDGANYEIPFTYQALKDAGWSFNLADYGYEDGFVLNPNTKTFGTIKLTNPAYENKKIAVQIGFINKGEKALDILDCDIWFFMLDTCLGYKQAEKYPEMEVAKGIKLGSSREEVEAAFGKCDDVYEAKGHEYVTYNYSGDHGKYIRFKIFEAYGVTSIELKSY